MTHHGDFVRIGPHLYNDASDIEGLFVVFGIVPTSLRNIEIEIAIRAYPWQKQEQSAIRCYT
jgi:hypothetical protein